MRIRLPAITLALLCGVVVWCGAKPAAAATPLPFATLVVPPTPHTASTHEAATSIALLPRASDLLSRMRTAMAALGSVHVDFHMVSALYPSGRAQTHLTGDVSWRSNSLHDTTVIERVRSAGAVPIPDENMDLFFVRQQAASRTQTGTWQCERLPHVNVISTLLGLQATVVSSRTVGVTFSGTTPVWVVEATGYSPATGSVSLAHITFDISQSDYSLQMVRISEVALPAANHGLTVASERYTHYGEIVHVRLPSACTS